MRAILNKSMPRATTRLTRKNPPVTKKPVQIAATLKFPENARAAAIQGVYKTPAPDGGFHIQVGAYSRQRDAMDRLAAIQQTAGEVITGHAPLAMPLVEPNRNLYRARFAGFTRQAADSTCNQLKQRAITCVVMSAE